MNAGRRRAEHYRANLNSLPAAEHHRRADPNSLPAAERHRHAEHYRADLNNFPGAEHHHRAGLSSRPAVERHRHADLSSRPAVGHPDVGRLRVGQRMTPGVIRLHADPWERPRVGHPHLFPRSHPGAEHQNGELRPPFWARWRAELPPARGPRHVSLRQWSSSRLRLSPPGRGCAYPCCDVEWRAYSLFPGSPLWRFLVLNARGCVPPVSVVPVPAYQENQVYFS